MDPIITGVRRITNEVELVQNCRIWMPPTRCMHADTSATSDTGAHSHCSTWIFGRRGFVADLAAVREADVLVGTHGAALVHSLFMEEGSALVEVRPYGFTGRWPDQYHYALARQQNSTHAFVIQTRDRTLCESKHTNGVPPGIFARLHTLIVKSLF